MFETYTILDIIIISFLMYVLVRIIALMNDPTLLELKERLTSLEQVECVVEEINGQFYLWMIIPNEGYQFVGQGASREYLAEMGQKFLLRKYGVSND